MKKASLLILFFSFCFSAFCQELTPDKADFNLSYSASIGENFLANRMGAGYGQWLNDKVGVRFGIASTDFAFKCPFEKVEDKAPYSAKGKQISLNAALDYKASDKLLLSFSAYFSTMNLWNQNFTTKAVNASMRYVFKNDSFIDISLTVVESNSPFPYYFYEPTSFWLP